MNKNNFLTVALLASALTLGQATASPLKTTNQTKINTLSSSIASILHKRGIDEDAAQKISNEFVSKEDENLFAIMLYNLENGCNVVNRDEILEHLSRAALHRQTIKLDSYSYLVSMVHKIRKKALNKETLLQLDSIATKNILFSRVIAA